MLGEGHKEARLELTPGVFLSAAAGDLSYTVGDRSGASCTTNVTLKRGIITDESPFVTKSLLGLQQFA